MSQGKIVVLSAPSGCGKSTIIKAILDSGEINLSFSVSATNREPRQGEIDGTHYHFLTTEKFQELITNGHFVEWEEVYPGRFYGTLYSEINTKLSEGLNIILDIDVKGAMNVKKSYGNNALTIFIEPPSIAELRRRLITRATDSPEVIETRVSKAEYEIGFADKFDRIIVNDKLSEAVKETETAIKEFLNL